jgi:pimeloyl-ACP methyl ester carboxylesterase
MYEKVKRFALCLGFAVLVLGLTSGSAQAQATVKTIPGMLGDGATYLIEFPSNWNGVLLLYSHGYVTPGSLNPPQVAGDPITAAALLSQGFALAGSSYATTGWAIHEALPDQIAVLEAFKQMFGKPKATVAWGHSLGGIITAGLIQRFPRDFDAAMPLCGVLAGGVGTWNQALDAEFAFKTLGGPAAAGLQLVDITHPAANFELAEALLAGAQGTAQGRARIALANALGNTPGWFTPLSPEPAENDFADQEMNQFLWSANVDFPFIFAFRAELEARAGGNVSFNTGVDYRKKLNESRDREEVRALYQSAGLSLDADLDALNDAQRIKSDPKAQRYLEENIIFDGLIHIPVLTMHTTGDGLVVVENEQAYRKIVDELGNERFLRQTFVHRAGHCTFTPGETLTLFGELFDRLETGHWPNLNANELNTAAAALGPSVNIFPAGSTVVPTAPAFIDFQPGKYLRPFDAITAICDAFPDPDRCRDIFSRDDDR